MPIYLYDCPGGHTFERVMTVAYHRSMLYCKEHRTIASQIITAPIIVKVAQDVHYTSPIDERPITNWHAREEDLKRNGCTPYDEGQKQDYHTRLKESEAALDKTIDIAVESAIEKMPTAKRGKLYSELTEQGVTADVSRS